jgi:hypothetical protein
MTIDILALSEADLGCGVVYRPHRGAQAEDGVITSFNHLVVFVRYRGDTTSKATVPVDLEWLGMACVAAEIAKP